MPLFLSDFNKLKGTSLHKPIMSMMKHFIQGIKADEGTRGALVYDAVAAYYLVRPKAFTLGKIDILIETRGEHTFGMTVVERRFSAKKAYNSSVVKNIEREQFRENFIAILKK